MSSSSSDPLRRRTQIETDFVQHVRAQADFLATDRQAFVKAYNGDSRQKLMALNEDAFEKRRSQIKCMVKSMKGIAAAASLMNKHSTDLVDILESVATDMMNDNDGTTPELAKIMIKCAVFQREANSTQVLKHKRLNRTSLQPLERIIQEIDESEDLAKRFDKRFHKQHGLKKKDSGIYPNAGMDLRTCDYLLMVNEIKFKTDVDLVQSTMDMTEIQSNTVDSRSEVHIETRKTIEEMSRKIARWRCEYITERQVLLALRYELKSAMAKDVATIQLGRSHFEGQFNGMGATDASSKSGWVYKKSARFGGFSKRWIAIENEFIFIYASQPLHPQDIRQRKSIMLCTCTVKEVRTSFPKFSFTVISPSHSWTFAVGNQSEHISWITCIRNAICNALADDNATNPSTPLDPNVAMYKLFLNTTRTVVGNDVCADCGDDGPEWVAINLGILICLACSGIHRQMGCQVSIVRSLHLDNLSMSDILLTRALGNRMSNSVYEAAHIPEILPGKAASMEARCRFIKLKYLQHTYVIPEFRKHNFQSELMLAIKTSDLRAMVQLVAQGWDVNEPLMGIEEAAITPLHYAVMRNSVVCTSFLANSPCMHVNAKTSITQSTALHLAVKGRNIEILKVLLLRSPDLQAVDSAGMTPLMLALNVSTWEEDNPQEDEDDDDKRQDSGFSRKTVLIPRYSTDLNDTCVALLTEALRSELDECKTIDIDDWGVSATPLASCRKNKRGNPKVNRDTNIVSDDDAFDCVSSAMEDIRSVGLPTCRYSSLPENDLPLGADLLEKDRSKSSLYSSIKSQAKPKFLKRRSSSKLDLVFDKSNEKESKATKEHKGFKDTVKLYHTARKSKSMGSKSETLAGATNSEDTAIAPIGAQRLRVGSNSFADSRMMDVMPTTSGKSTSARNF
eukprot:CFRG5379T1